MKYFHTITPISDERRENRKNEIDAYINDIKKTIVLIILRKRHRWTAKRRIMSERISNSTSILTITQSLTSKELMPWLTVTTPRKKYPSPLYKTSSVTVIRYKKKLYKIKAFWKFWKISGKKFFGTLNSTEIYPLYEIRFWNCNPVWKNSPYGIFLWKLFFLFELWFLLFNFLVFLFFLIYIFLLIKRRSWKSWKFPEKFSEATVPRVFEKTHRGIGWGGLHLHHTPIIPH